VRLDRRSFLPLVALMLTACGDDRPPTTPTPTPATVVSVAIDGPAQRDLGAPGQTLQLRAIATLSDGSRPDVTNDAAWSTGNSRVLSVSARGLVTGLGNGTTTVTATYRERAGAAGLRVADELGPRFLVSGTVRDAERGTPIVGATVYPWRLGESPVGSIYVSPPVRTDGNGFFEFGTLAGGFIVYASQFGYEDSAVSVPPPTAATSLDIRLKPDTAPYIERRLTGEFDGVDDLGVSVSTVRISTRGSGVFDAVLRARSCDHDGSVQIDVSNGRSGSLGSSFGCGDARQRVVLRTSEVLLTLRGHKVRGWELIYREPR
jgi:hypothetical protein